METKVIDLMNWLGKKVARVLNFVFVHVKVEGL